MKNEAYKDFIEEVLNNDYKGQGYGGVQGVFDKFYIPFLSHMEEMFENFIAEVKSDADFNMGELVTDSFVCSVKDSLIEISIKTLITEFYSFKESNSFDDNLTSEEVYETFNSFAGDRENIRNILDKYEVLAYLVYIRLTDKFNLVRDALLNLKADIKEIRDGFNKEFKTLESISLNNGDTHNGGKSVMIFNFDNNEKLVYKPHGLEPDKALDKIYEFINKTGLLKAPLKNVKNISKKEYGWQDFAEYTPCKEYKDAKNYYYRIGAILALFNILKTGDIHSENMIAGSDNPYLIDLETLLTNENMEGLDDTLLVSYLKEMNNSVFGCYILPQNLEYSVIDIDLSGLSGDGGAKSDKITGLALKDTGKSTIRFEKEYVVSSENNNKPTLDGRKLTGLEFAEDIEKGFEDTYTSIMNNKESFLEVLCDALKDGAYRQVLRPTFIYAKYLEASYHPKYLKEFSERQRLFDILRTCDVKTYNNNPVKNKKAEYESNTMMRDDIPYFNSDFETLNLYINSDEKMDDYFIKTLKDTVIERVNELDEESMKTQLSYIRNSLLTTKKDVFKGCMNSSEKIPVKEDDIDFTLRSIGDYIYNRAIFNTSGTACTYPNLNINGDKTLIGPLNYALYEGAGLILFLYGLGEALNDEKYKDLAQASLKGMEEIRLSNDNLIGGSSVFSGVGSLIYLYYNLSVMTGSDEMKSKYNKYLDKLMNFEIFEHDNIDIIGGDAGIIIALLNIYEASRDEKALKAAGGYAKYLYEYFKKNEDKQFLSGFSHGYSGFALALIMAGRLMDNKDYYNMGLSLVKKEDLLYRDNLRNWIDLRDKDEESGLNFWCHGAPGITLARSIMRKYADKKDEGLIMKNVSSGIDQFVENGFNRDIGHSLCHGSLGNIDMLTEIAANLNDTSLAKKKDELFTRSLAYMREDGVKYGIYDTLAMMGFMSGISGIGYSILRQKNGNLPSVLSLQVLKSEVIDYEHTA